MKVPSPNARPIVLIGYRGAGKTTVGQELARLLNLPLIDTDEMIVRRTGRTIAQIFAEEGEPGFRGHERGVIREIAGNDDMLRSGMILSVGGGAVVDPESRETLRRLGFVVWLEADRAALARRLAADPDTETFRPHLRNSGGAPDADFPPERVSLYGACAHQTVSTTDKSPAEIAGEIVALLPVSL
ncbi:MAG: shikimate kinase [Phycisphaerae bacterium]|nr:shikimate kinase [Phycisphaerae bacterium]